MYTVCHLQETHGEGPYVPVSSAPVCRVAHEAVGILFQHSLEEQLVLLIPGWSGGNKGRWGRKE